MSNRLLARRRFLGGVAASALAAYAANGITPPFVFQAVDDVYATGGTATTRDMLTVTGDGLRTFYNADGNLVWNAHNLLTYSDNASLAPSGRATFSTDATGTLVTHTTGNGGFVGETAIFYSDAAYTEEVEVKYSTMQWVRLQLGSTTSGAVWFDLINEVKGTEGATASGDITILDDGWLRLKITVASPSGALGLLYLANGDNVITATPGEGVYVRKRRAYRSDLGGIAPNPATGDSYVPTTDSAVYLPRYNSHVYDGSTWVKKGLKIESAAATNLATYSSDFTNATWVKVRASVIENTDGVVAPDGSTAQKMLGTTDTNTHFTYINITATGDRVLSVYAKAAELSWMLLTNTGFGVLTASYNLSTGAIGTVTGFSDTFIEDVGGGWYRCSAVVPSATADGSFDFVIALGDGDNAFSFVGAVDEGLYIYGAQFEVGSKPSSYIPTAGSSQTRAAETAVFNSALLPYPAPAADAPELVTNGTFDTDSDWTKGTGWTISGGVASCDGTNFSTLEQAETITSGTIYEVTYTVSEYVSGSVRFELQGGGADSGAIIQANGTYTEVVVATAARTVFRFLSAGGGFNGSIDNISVKEIENPAVSFSMKGLMSYADNDTGTSANGGFGEVVWLNWSLDGNNRLDIAMSTSASRIGQVSFNQEAAAAISSVFTGFSEFSPGINAPFSIASRHGSTFVNGAVDGTALTANTTPTAFPALSGIDLQLATTFDGHISEVIMWGLADGDIGDAGIAEASA